MVETKALLLSWPRHEVSTNSYKCENQWLGYMNVYLKPFYIDKIYKKYRLYFFEMQ